MLSIIFKIFIAGVFHVADMTLYRGTLLILKPEQKINASRISRNIVAFVHAIVTLILSGFYQIIYSSFIFNIMCLFSSGYFIFDTHYIIKYESIDLLRVLYLYHHLASIYILNHGPEYQIYKILFWAELSNIPTYIVYHLLKTEPKSYRLTKWKQIQKYIYLIIRVPILGYLSYYIYYKIDDKVPFYVCFPVYLIGILWTLALLIR